MEEKITIAGIGPGGWSELTGGAKKIFLSADVVIGAGRMLDDLRRGSGNPPKIYIEEYRPELIAEYVSEDLQKHPEKRFFIAVSGDSGFFSGSAGIRSALENSGAAVRVLPGISSLSYLCAKAGVSWQDAVCVSAHGRDVNIASEVRRNPKTFVLTGGNAAALLKRLVDFGLGGVTVIAGERLSYEDERITVGSAQKLAETAFAAFDGLTSLLIINDDARQGFSCGMEDSAFVRGEIPMTKREVRGATISRMNLRPDSIVYDVGAGTGSVTVEAALTSFRGHVFAVEKNPKGVQLIAENCRRFSADNVTVVEGRAPAALKGLPAPDAVFIGGTDGALEEILSELCEPQEQRFSEKDESVRIVMNAVSMESIGAAMPLFEKYGAENLEAVQISAARTRKVGRHHLLSGQNPVFIVSGDFRKRKKL